MTKVICRECEWHGMNTDLLRAPHPFDPEDTVSGCPGCKSINSMLLACDKPECWNVVTCGWSSAKGYRRTCGEHMEGKRWATST